MKNARDFFRKILCNCSFRTRRAKFSQTRAIFFPTKRTRFGNPKLYPKAFFAQKNARSLHFYEAALINLYYKLKACNFTRTLSGTFVNAFLRIIFARWLLGGCSVGPRRVLGGSSVGARWVLGGCSVGAWRAFGEKLGKGLEL